MCQKEQFSPVEQGPLSEGEKLLYASPVSAEAQDKKHHWNGDSLAKYFTAVLSSELALCSEGFEERCLCLYPSSTHHSCGVRPAS